MPVETLEHPVFELMRDRKREGSKPWDRTDDQKLGIVVEGGSLRAVASAATLAQLYSMGYRDSVDAVYGESVGACNGTVFISGQIPEAIRTYWELVNNRLFFNPFRFWKMVDTDYFLDQVKRHYSFNFLAFQNSGIKLGVMAARVNKPKHPDESYPLVMLSDFKDKADLMGSLKGAIQMPFFCGPPYPYKNMKLWDGGIIDKFPVKAAIEDGCTHILAVLASPVNHVPKDLKPLEKYASMVYLAMFNPEIARYYSGVRERFRQTMEFLREKQTNQDKPPYIASLGLSSGTRRLSTFELSEKVLRDMADRAGEVVRKLFEQYER